MEDLSGGELLMCGGITLMVCATVAAVIACIVLHISKKRLKAHLEKEFGEKRH